LLNEAFGEQGHKEFPIQPCLGAFVVLFGKMSQLGQLLEALKNQFNRTRPANAMVDGSGWPGIGYFAILAA
jgi:hypothetical protein